MYALVASHWQDRDVVLCMLQAIEEGQILGRQPRLTLLNRPGRRCRCR